MRENDIIENIRDLYDVKAPNVREKLDFSAVEIVPPPEKKLNRRYVFAGIAYAAACLVVIGLIPFLIGKSGSEPVKPNPGMSAVAVDTSDNTEATDEPKENFTERDIVTEEPVVSAEPDVTEEPGSDVVQTEPVIPENDGVTTPVTTPKEPEAASTTTGKKPAVTTKKPAEATTATKTEPEPEKPSKPVKVYADPAKSTRIRFFKDVYHTDEYKSAADIPYGAEVYYVLDNDPGYIFTNFKMNLYKSDFDIAGVPGEGHDAHVLCFTNNYQGDKLEYSYTAVLAGDADGNLYYDENDVEILRKYLDKDAETWYYYGQYGYNEKLDYDCNGVVTEKDLEGLLGEIENGTAERNTMSQYNYNSGVGTKTTLLKFDKATIMPHGLYPYQVEYDYSVHKTYAEAAPLSKEIHDKYNSNFYVMKDLILIYCYTKDGAKPELSEIQQLWCTSNNHIAYLTPVYSDNNVGQTLSEYAIVLEISNNKYLSTPAPR